MAALSVREQIAQQLDKLTPEQQQALLDYALRLQAMPAGTSGEVLLAHIHDFNFEPGEVDQMMSAIEDAFERIDWDEWK